MSRSPLAYPLTRPIDGDAGGAADLQTDIMRFMAILALCLVAIFALVQSIPLAAETPPVAEAAAPEVVQPSPVADTPAPMPAELAPEPVTPTEPEIERAVVLKRPRWTTTFTPREERLAVPTPVAPRTTEPVSEPPRSAAATTATVAEPAPIAPPSTEPEGFTLRFESDLALTRLVAAGQVGFYAIAAQRAQRMAVSDSRISFWDASTPNAFHEMDAATVPQPVVEALTMTGVDAQSVDWGVTLPGRLREELGRLMREHSGGALVITADGKLNLEAS